MNPGVPMSRAIIDLDAYAHNLRTIGAMVPEGCGLMPVVKADAYGHGAVPVAQRALAEGVPMLATAMVEEGVALREAGITAPILLMMAPLADAVAPIVEYDLRVTLSDVALAEAIGEQARRAGKVVPVHCKVDTGMGRQGFPMETAAAEMLRITRISHIDIEGVCTHFPIAEATRDPFTQQQVRLFRNVLRDLDREGVPYELVHACNSAGIVNHPEAAFDLVRPGLMSYGVWPTDTPPGESPLRPVLRWESRITLLRDLRPGDTIGYGRSYRVERQMRAAVVPVGYGDGYPWSLSGKGEVLVHGRRLPLCGRVSMDQLVVDVTDCPQARVGDTVVLIGADGDDRITAEELAEKADTIPYEILCRIAPRVARHHVG